MRRREVTIQNIEDLGLGLGLVADEGAVGPVFISSILSGGAAAACGQLSEGDRILGVNGVNVTWARMFDVVNLIQESGNKCRLAVNSKAEALYPIIRDLEKERHELPLPREGSLSSRHDPGITELFFRGVLVQTRLAAGSGRPSFRIVGGTNSPLSGIFVDAVSGNSLP